MDLTWREIDLLLLLARQPAQVLTREHLVAHAVTDLCSTEALP